jgi:hypothetical protein
MPYIVASTIGVVLALAQWITWFSRTRVHPLMTAIATVIAIVATFLKYRQIKKQVQALKLGRDGERVVGRHLDELMRKGYHIFHDVQGDDFNADHVVISPHGVFVVETKTYSKPVRGNAKVEFDGERVLVNGWEPDRNPVIQAKALRKWLYDLLLKSTGKTFPVKAIVTFPGWYVETVRRPRTDEVWVLNPKAIPSFIDHKPEVLKSEDVHLASFHLSRYIQSME